MRLAEQCIFPSYMYHRLKKNVLTSFYARVLAIYYLFKTNKNIVK